MLTTIYVPINRFHWLLREINRDWLVVVETIYTHVSAYLVDHAMPDYAESWKDLAMEPRHKTLKLSQEIVDYFTELGRGDFKLGFFIAIEVYRFSVDPDGVITSWAIYNAMRKT